MRAQLQHPHQNRFIDLEWPFFFAGMIVVVQRLEAAKLEVHTIFLIYLFY